MKANVQNEKPYTVFSTIYDQIMGHVDYKNWANFIIDTIPNNTKKIQTLDLACGTGILFQFYPKNISSTGLDISEEMLIMARQKNANSEFHSGNICNFDLNKKFDFITCNHDSINYILDFKDLVKHFTEVKKHLTEDGIYLFDISSEDNLLKNFHNKIFRDKIDDTFLIWENEYNQSKKEIQSKLFFSVNSKEGTIEFKETHIQKLYSIEEIKEALKLAGLKFVKIGADYKIWSPRKICSLINFYVTLDSQFN